MYLETYMFFGITFETYFHFKYNFCCLVYIVTVAVLLVKDQEG